jgi:hypothetical protein
MDIKAVKYEKIGCITYWRYKDQQKQIDNQQEQINELKNIN